MKRAQLHWLVGLSSVVAAAALAACSGSDAPANSGQAGAGSPGQAGSGTSGAAPAGGSPATGTGGSGVAGSGVAGSGVAGANTSGGMSSTGGSPAGGGGSSAGGAAGKGGAAGAAGGGTAGGTASGMSTGCGKMPTISSDMYNNGKNIPITAANLQRRYILSVPANYSNTKPYRLIIAWHQRDGNDNQMYANKYYHLQPLDKDGTTIFVAPNGQLNGKPCTGTGNGESSCGWPNPNDSDMALGDAVVAQVEENFCIDTNRIFATGWSFGGSMSYANACERPLGADKGYIRAIAVYSGSQLSGNCKPSKPVAYYASHGTHDSVLPYANGLTLAQNFAMANGCTWATPTAVTSGNHMCTDLMGCMSGYPEEFCSFNGDHTPDPSDGGMSWEYANVWKFFSQF
jgi:poly(3-hydroxybutyrate) depolymerase